MASPIAAPDGATGAAPASARSRTPRDWTSALVPLALALAIVVGAWIIGGQQGFE